ncbi:hypothetical protein H6CHR_03051 [Variovorax sp. PBL-H6]|uniref:hypothetical protein n=1 Tax=Variovorax sp. PBL-H6 TaxID=434009 RepID=UPI00131871CA|nr:hypothetical protein [Variovorax sp. PBL-H6]VTU28735.1 hypothetical protein H6CHR_03051 [Variovorax sp. PBL-H6]
MNTKVLVIFAVTFAGAVSAQTVPPEQWVGSPIPSASFLSRSAVVADYVATAPAEARTPQEFRVGPPDAQPGGLSRAEAVADLNLWLRSGLGQSAYRDDFDPAHGHYRAQVAIYQRLRHGPEFTAEVARIQGSGAFATTAQATATPADE